MQNSVQVPPGVLRLSREIDLPTASSAKKTSNLVVRAIQLILLPEIAVAAFAAAALILKIKLMQPAASGPIQ